MSNSYAVSPSDIIKAYAKHKENMIVIDTKFRESGNKMVKYFDIKLKKEDGKLYPVRIKFFNQEVSNRIKEPKDRDYEQLKISFQSKENDQFSKAMELVCDSFGKVIKDMKNKKVIGDDDDEADKDTIMVPNCKPSTPMQKFAKDKEGNRVDFEHPLFWFVPAYRRYKDEEVAKLPKLNYNYKMDNKKFLIKDFDISFYDLDSLDKSTGIPSEAIINDSKINNSNIHEFVTKGSLASGILQMQAIASKQSFSLNTKFASKLYVKTNHNQSAGGNYFDDDDFATMLKGAGATTLSKKVEEDNFEENTNTSENKDKYESDDDDDALDKIKGLSL
jgi:hypothetical protein